MTDQQRSEIQQKILEALSKEENALPLERDQISNKLYAELYAEVVGYGPIQSILEDPKVL